MKTWELGAERKVWVWGDMEGRKVIRIWGKKGHKREIVRDLGQKWWKRGKLPQMEYGFCYGMEHRDKQHYHSNHYPRWYNVDQNPLFWAQKWWGCCLSGHRWRCFLPGGPKWGKKGRFGAKMDLKISNICRTLKEHQNVEKWGIFGVKMSVHGNTDPHWVWKCKKVESQHLNLGPKWPKMGKNGGKGVSKGDIWGWKRGN